MKALEQLKNSNLSYSKNSAKTLQDFVSKKLLPFLNSIDNRRPSLLNLRFKDKWIENDVQKKEAMLLLQVHVTSRLGHCEECSTSQMIKTLTILAKSQGYLALSQLV